MRRHAPLRLALFGYGAVASIHARHLASTPQSEVSVVFGPDRERAEAFAARHGIPRGTDQLDTVLDDVQAVLICSPSTEHFAQAAMCLERELDVLVELPPCANTREAEELMRLAERRSLVLCCAHTSRYLEPYRLIGDQIRAGVAGIAYNISYTRHFTSRHRNWRDDVLLHHSAHPLDLLLHWFGEVEPLGCAAWPADGPPRNVGILARLADGAPAALSLSYDSSLPSSLLRVVGSRCTLETDGFSYLRSDLAELNFTGNGEAVYAAAIGAQDLDFVRACQGERTGVPWGETVRLLRLLDRFAQLRIAGK